MSRFAIVTDLDRCVGCHACTVACKLEHGVPIGRYWNRVVRVGPTPKEGGSGNWPDVDMFFFNMSCQHCANPQCVEVCPTGASAKLENGIVRIDPEVCIGCQLCVAACPYGVRYLNEDKNVVEKCDLCADRVANGELPRCVSQCCGMARWFGDLDEGVETFKGPRDAILGEYLAPYSDDQVHQLPDMGNVPEYLYIQREITWHEPDIAGFNGVK